MSNGHDIAQELAQTKTELKVLMQGSDDRETRMRELQDYYSVHMTELQDSHLAQIKKLEDDCKSFTTKEEGWNADMATLKRKIDLSEESVKDLSEDKRTLTETLDARQVTISESTKKLTKIKKTLTETTHELAENKLIASESEGKIDEMSKLLAEEKHLMLTTLETNESLTQDLQEYQSLTSETESRCRDALETTESLRQNLQKQKGVTLAAENKCKKLVEELDNTNATSSTQSHKTQKLVDTIAEYKGSEADGIEERANLTACLANEKKQHEACKDTCKKLEKDNAKCKELATTLTDHKIRHSNVTNDYDKLTACLVDEKAKHKECIKRCKLLEKDFENVSNDLRHMKETSEGRTGRLNHYIQKLERDIGMKKSTVRGWSDNDHSPENSRTNVPANPQPTPGQGKQNGSECDMQSLLVSNVIKFMQNPVDRRS
jgi:chromosome segregation ATPase